MNFNIEIVSDLICPWCYIGKRKLEAALQTLREERPDVSTHVAWLPFELNPQMPPEGLDRKTYRSAKFGSWAKSQQLDAGVAQAGSEVGIRFDFERMERTPNTFEGHRLLWLAKTESEAMQNALSETLFRAYFCDGENLNDRATLIRLAAECGLEASRVEAFLSGDEGAREVREEQTWAQGAGVSGVPFFVFNRTHGTSGAQSSDDLLSLMRQILADAPIEAAASTVENDCESGACSIEGAAR